MNEFFKFFTGFKDGFKDFAQLITKIVNSILLTIVYFVGVGPTSIVAKIVKKDFLDIDKRRKNTYWTDLNLRKKKLDEYYRQF